MMPQSWCCPVFSTSGGGTQGATQASLLVLVLLLLFVLPLFGFTIHAFVVLLDTDDADQTISHSTRSGRSLRSRVRPHLQRILRYEQRGEIAVKIRHAHAFRKKHDLASHGSPKYLSPNISGFQADFVTSVANR